MSEQLELEDLKAGLAEYRAAGALPMWTIDELPAILELAIAGAQARAATVAWANRSSLGAADYRIEEGHRQMILLAISELAVARPGWVWALSDLADTLRGREMFDKFRNLAKIGPLMLATNTERVERVRETIQWLKDVIAQTAVTAGTVEDQKHWPYGPTVGEATIARSHASAVFLLEALGQLEPGPAPVVSDAQADHVIDEILGMSGGRDWDRERARDLVRQAPTIAPRALITHGLGPEQGVTEPAADATLSAAELAMRHSKPNPRHNRMTLEASLLALLLAAGFGFYLGYGVARQRAARRWSK